MGKRLRRVKKVREVDRLGGLRENRVRDNRGKMEDRKGESGVR